ncbi:phage transcriptional regulator [Clostridium sartagoforme AAU1]|uniref:Phage transcriptional regulator n=1 Tax=Clostridium sartagoforme AAU1 TaxID=1202534 RepID=R9C577_9CLOT|nr:helix-turn-helix transcriptional regulator [Clostridium sartagoforme]EOR24457.1 phage transcriptional regulator [Clostridium sartagoforme AAU1]
MNIKLERIKRNIKQKELADELGITTQYLRLIELGKVDIRRNLMIKIAKILNVSIQELFFSEIKEENR